MHLLARLACLSVITLAAAAPSGCSAGVNADNKAAAAKPSTTPAPAMKRYLLETSEGPITLGLYTDTPKHAANFDTLARKGYYDGMLFHRVINEFMIQTGDPDSRNAAPGARLGSGGPGYQIDAEIVYPAHFNKRGALAAARTGDQVNPERRSSGSQFYIVTGRKFTPVELDAMESQMTQQSKQAIFNDLARNHMAEIRQLQAAGDNAGLRALQEELVKQTEAQAAANPFRFTPEQREAYTTVGGAPHLDGAYTVFGEVLDGWPAIEKIEKAATDAADRPTSDIRILSVKPLD